MKALLLASLIISLPVLADDFESTHKGYKPASQSSTIHNRIDGEVASQFYNLMVKVEETERVSEKLTIRKSDHMECVHFYGDGYYECFYRLNEDGTIEAGY